MRSRGNCLLFPPKGSRIVRSEREDEKREKERGVSPRFDIDVASVENGNGAYVRNATRPHTRTRATAGFIKNTHPYFLRRVVAERASSRSLGSRAFADYRFHTRAHTYTHARDEEKAARRIRRQR